MEIRMRKTMISSTALQADEETKHDNEEMTEWQAENVEDDKDAADMTQPGSFHILDNLDCQNIAERSTRGILTEV
jgi:hypothetical protein